MIDESKLQGSSFGQPSKWALATREHCDLIRARSNELINIDTSLYILGILFNDLLNDDMNCFGLTMYLTAPPELIDMDEISESITREWLNIIERISYKLMTQEFVENQDLTEIVIKLTFLLEKLKLYKWVELEDLATDQKTWAEIVEEAKALLSRPDTIENPNILNRAYKLAREQRFNVINILKNANQA